MSLFARKPEESRSDWRPVVDDAPPTPSPRPVAVEMAADEHEEADARLGKGSRVSGKLSFDGSVRIHGEVEGQICAAHTVVVELGAVVTARIEADTVVVKGEIAADVNARKRLVIEPSGCLRGNVVTGALVIHEGAVFHGKCSMDGGAEDAEGRSAKKPAKPLREEPVALSA